MMRLQLCGKMEVIIIGFNVIGFQYLKNMKEFNKLYTSVSPIRIFIFPKFKI